MADGNEALSVDQLSSIMSVANVSEYGLVKVLPDDVLDKYMNGGKGADNDSLELTEGSEFSFNTFGFTASCSGGVVTISGEATFGSMTISNGRSYVLFTLPSGYAPATNQSSTTNAAAVNYGYGNFRYIQLDCNEQGDVYFASMSNMSNAYSIRLNQPFTFPVVVEESVELDDGIYVVTVAQAIKYLSSIKDDSSGDDGGDSDTGNGKTLLFESSSGVTQCVIDLYGSYNTFVIELGRRGSSNVTDYMNGSVSSGSWSVNGYVYISNRNSSNMTLQSIEYDIYRVYGVNN